MPVNPSCSGEAFSLIALVGAGADGCASFDGCLPVEKRLLKDEVGVCDADFGSAGTVAVILGDGAVDHLKLALSEEP